MNNQTVFLGLGANVGDALETLTAAIYALDDIDNLAVEDVSGIYKTPPWPPADDPRAVAQDDYLNLAVRATTTLTAHDLLAQTQLIEAAFGRDRAAETRWGPRPLDIDLLLYGDEQIDTPTLVVPHPHIAERAFVLIPLIEIFPGGALPDGRRLSRLIAEHGAMDDIELVVRLDGMPGRIARPQGPGSPAATFTRPDVDDVARAHGDRQ